MKKTLLLAILALLLSEISAQNQRFIEIIAEESVELKAMEYEVEINIYSISNYFGNSEQGEYMDDFLDANNIETADESNSDTKQNADKLKETVENNSSSENNEEEYEDTTYTNLVKLLVKNNYKYSEIASGFIIPKISLLNKNNDKQALYVKVKSKKEFEKLKKMLKISESYSAKITSTIFEPINVHYESLYKKLYQKGITQAKMLAKVSGNKIGELISASEIVNNNSSTSFFGKIFSDIYTSFLETELQTKQVALKMSFKFELK